MNTIENMMKVQSVYYNALKYDTINIYCRESRRNYE